MICLQKKIIPIRRERNFAPVLVNGISLTFGPRSSIKQGLLVFQLFLLSLGIRLKCVINVCILVLEPANLLNVPAATKTMLI